MQGWPLGLCGRAEELLTRLSKGSTGRQGGRDAGGRKEGEAGERARSSRWGRALPVATAAPGQGRLGVHVRDFHAVPLK